MDGPKFTVSEIAEMENGLKRVTLRLSDDTLMALTAAYKHGGECQMSAVFTLPSELVPLTVGQTTGFAPTGAP